MCKYNTFYLSSDDWINVLTELNSVQNRYNDRILSIINCLFLADDYKLNAKAIGDTLNTAYQRLNLDIGGFGKHLYDKYKNHSAKNPPLRKNGVVRWWNIVFDGEDAYEDGKAVYYWQLKKEMLKAIKKLNLFYRTKEEREKSARRKEQIRINQDVSNFKGEEKKAFVKIRVNQSRLRSDILKEKNCCQICGLRKKELLIVSHIKPWSKSSETERVDHDNVMLLCPNHDSLFDKGYISFSENGNILLSSNIAEEELLLMNVDKNFRLEVSDAMRKYLDYHRQSIFKI